MNALGLLPGCRLQAVLRPDPTTLRLVITTTRRATCRCPACGRVSRSGHGHYHRHAADRPCFDRRVLLAVRLRRFRCRNPACPRRTFSQNPEGLLARRAQRTRRLAQAQAAVGVALGGEAGARLLDRLGMPASASTLLRTVRALPLPTPELPRVLGVDDWAMKRSTTYGTILVDLERRRVVDLLPDRTSATLVCWLRAHPGVEVIARDRSTEFARGASLGAPAAVQVADRWHLLSNAQQTLERWLAGVHGRLRGLAPAGSRLLEPAGRRAVAFPRSGGERAAGAASRARWCAVFEEVRRRRAAGQGLRAIARTMALARSTVRRFAHAHGFPSRAVRAPGPSLLDPHVGWLQEQLAAGRDNASALWRELRERGFGGGPGPVLRWVGQRRLVPAKKTPHCWLLAAPAAMIPASDRPLAMALPSPKELAWLLLHPPRGRTSPEAQAVARVERDAEVSRIAVLLREFTSLVGASGPSLGPKRVSFAPVALFEDWLQRAAACGVAVLATFAAGLRQDGAAVRAALTQPWSSGQAEGQINRLKMLKRQMYGRAHFDLLRRRVLLAT